jgi:dUTP pyrophosphatase
MKLRIQKLHPGARVPEYMSDGAAAFDLYATTINGYYDDAGASVYPDFPAVVGTGLAFEIPDGYMLDIRSRSGLAFKHQITAFPGTIDSDYRGEVQVLLTCSSLDDDIPALRIRPGDRIAQGVLMPVPRCVFEVCEQLTLTDRGQQGFGSTGGAA